ncbi:MAG: BPSS1780 family membrane protein [Gammaproteobacteria bacterium]|nr:BPSS1780 family membrane protein [Gammaproteobacteria bacterium]
MQTHSGSSQIVATRTGWQCLMRAADLIGQQVQVYVLVMLLWAGITLVLGQFPAGNLLIWLLVPVLQGGVMIMFDAQLHHSRLRPQQLFALFDHAQRNQLLLAMLWLYLIMFAALIMVMLPFADMLRSLSELSTVEDILTADLPLQQLYLMVVLMLLVFTLASLLWFFALPRIVFDYLPAGVALRESFRVCLQNWRALLTFSLAYMVIVFASMIIFGLVNVIPAVLLSASGAEIVTLLLTSFYVAALQLLSVGGVYLLWRQVFPRGEDRQAPEPQDKGRFIA